MTGRAFTPTRQYIIKMTWVKKPSNQTKNRIRLLAIQKRKRSQPEWAELTTSPQILQFCHQNDLSPDTCSKILKLQNSIPGETVWLDHRDYRSVPKAARVPRNLQGPPPPPSPTGYWHIEW